MLRCQYTLRAYVLTANVLTCSRANVPCVLTCSRALRAYVLTCLACLRAHVLRCSRANVPCVLTCSRVNVSCKPKCSRAITSNNKNKFQWHVLLRFLLLFLSFSCEIKLYMKGIYDRQECL